MKIKPVIAIFVFYGISFSVYSQFYKITNGKDTVDLSGSTIHVSCKTGDYEKYIYMRNNSGSSQRWNAAMKKMHYHTIGTYEGLCFGEKNFGYSCQWYIKGEKFVNTYSQTIRAGTEAELRVSIKFYNHQPAANKLVTDLYRVYFRNDENQPLDSIDFNVEGELYVHVAANTEDDSEYSEFQIFPQPANDVMHIHSKNNTPFKAEIMNSLGEKIYSTGMVETQTVLTSELASGVYLLKIEYQNGLFERKQVMIHH